MNFRYGTNAMNKIICGDALDALAKVPAESVHLVVTSPPYNLEIKYKNHSDNLSEREYLEWMAKIWRECKRVLCDGGRLCVNIGENKRQNIVYPTFSAFIQQCVKLEMLYRGTIIWNKNSAAKHCAWGSWKSPANPHLVPRHEYIIVFSKGSYRLCGQREDIDITPEQFMEYTRTVWNFGTESRARVGHPAPFPVNLPARLVQFYTYRGQTVLDPFAGSGTVGVACKMLGRNYVLIDNSAEYCELAKKRLANYKTEKPVPLHSGNGEVYHRVKSLSAKARKEIEQMVCREGLNGGEVGNVIVEEGEISVETDPATVAEAPKVIENDSYFLSLAGRNASGAAFCSVGYDIYAKKRRQPLNGKFAGK